MKNVFKILKRRSLKIRLISMLLAIVFVCIACPFFAYAVVETENTIEMQQKNDEITKGITKGAFETVGEEYSSDDMTGGITELVSLREENVKHFKMTDGTYRAVTYANEVHRKDAAGVWQEIDNRLIEKRENNVGLYGSSDGRVSFVRNFVPNQRKFDCCQ